VISDKCPHEYVEVETQVRGRLIVIISRCVHCGDIKYRRWMT